MTAGRDLQPKKLNQTVRFCLDANEVFPVEISDDDVLNAWSTQKDELSSICTAQAMVVLCPVHSPSNVWIRSTRGRSASQ
jgi:hypothetical protein